MEIFCEKLVLLDSESRICPAVLYMENGKFTKVESGTYDLRRLQLTGSKVF